MEDLTLRYYDAEMRYLREAAKEFAQAHPDRAAMLIWTKREYPIPMLNDYLKVLHFPWGGSAPKLTIIFLSLPKV